MNAAVTVVRRAKLIENTIAKSNIVIPSIPAREPIVELRRTLKSRPSNRTVSIMKGKANCEDYQKEKLSYSFYCGPE